MYFCDNTLYCTTVTPVLWLSPQNLDMSNSFREHIRVDITEQGTKNFTYKKLHNAT